MKKSLWIAVTAMVVGSGMTSLAATNAVFGSWSFETLTEGTVIPGASDTALGEPYGTWSADTNNGTAYVTSATPTGVTFPIDTTHTKALYFDGAVTNQFDGANLSSRIVTDFLLKPGQLEDLSLLNQVDGGARLAFFFDVNSNLNLMHGIGGFWATSTFATVYDSNAWLRITIEQDYDALPDFTSAGFTIAVNGTVLDHPNAYTRTGPGQFDFSGPGAGGTWFTVKNQINDVGLRGLVGMGIGMLDDVVNFQFVAGGVTFGSWITGFGLDAGDQDEGDDPDLDGYTNYQEYVMGTDPNDIDSFLAIQDIVIESNGDVKITFVGSADGMEDLEYALFAADTVNGFDLNGTPVATAVKAGGTINMTVPKNAIKKFFKVVISDGL